MEDKEVIERDKDIGTEVKEKEKIRKDMQFSNPGERLFCYSIRYNGDREKIQEAIVKDEIVTEDEYKEYLNKFSKSKYTHYVTQFDESFPSKFFNFVNKEITPEDEFKYAMNKPVVIYYNGEIENLNKDYFDCGIYGDRKTTNLIDEICLQMSDNEKSFLIFDPDACELKTIDLEASPYPFADEVDMTMIKNEKLSIFSESLTDKSNAIVFAKTRGHELNASNVKNDFSERMGAIMKCGCIPTSPGAGGLNNRWIKTNMAKMVENYEDIINMIKM